MNLSSIHWNITFSRFSATLRAQAAKIEADNELYRLTQARELELSYSKLVSALEIDKAKRLADIETNEFKEHVNAIGAKTIQAIATSGPDNQVRLNIVSDDFIAFYSPFQRLNFCKLWVLNLHWSPMDVVQSIFSIQLLIWLEHPLLPNKEHSQDEPTKNHHHLSAVRLERNRTVNCHILWLFFSFFLFFSYVFV